jgi:hypothetical protein
LLCIQRAGCITSATASFFLPALQHNSTVTELHLSHAHDVLIMLQCNSGIGHESHQDDKFSIQMLRVIAPITMSKNLHKIEYRPCNVDDIVWGCLVLLTGKQHVTYQDLDRFRVQSKVWQTIVKVLLLEARLVSESHFDFESHDSDLHYSDCRSDSYRTSDDSE